MLCPVCLEGADDGLDACQCIASRYHLPCLSDLRARDFERCGICCAYFDGGAVVKATRFGLDVSCVAFGQAHHETLRRRLLFTKALVDVGAFNAAAPVLRDVIAAALPSSMTSMHARLLFARCALAVGDVPVVVDAVRRLQARLALESRSADVRDLLSQSLRLLGEAYMQRGELTRAAKVLRKSMRVARAQRHSANAAAAIRSLGELCGAMGVLGLKALTQQVTLVFLQQNERDPGITAAAEAELGITEAELGLVHSAQARLRASLRVLRRRKNDQRARVLIPRAGYTLASLGLKPARRLRGRHHPEEVL